MFIGRSLNASLSQLGTLTLCRALFQALTSPISGALGDRYDRARVVAVGCALWGVMTAAIGLSTSLGQAMVSCAGGCQGRGRGWGCGGRDAARTCPPASLRPPSRLHHRWRLPTLASSVSHPSVPHPPPRPPPPPVNGFGLALVIPCVSSMVADLHPPDSRGGAFGMMGLTGGWWLGGWVHAHAVSRGCWQVAAAACQKHAGGCGGVPAGSRRKLDADPCAPRSLPLTSPSLAGRHDGLVCCHQPGRHAAAGHRGLALCIPPGASARLDGWVGWVGGWGFALCHLCRMGCPCCRLNRAAPPQPTSPFLLTPTARWLRCRC